MAATGFTPLSLYYSATTTNAPTAGNLVNGELAINIIDGKLFYKDNSGVVQVIATKSATSGIFIGTGAITVPVGTTAQEPTGVQGMLRFNTTTGSFEGYNGTVWGAIGGGGASTITRTDFTATSGQTVFTISYVAGAIDVYRNGIKLANADYTATNGTSVTLATGAITGDLIECVVYSVIAIAATVSTFSGGSTGLTPATATSGAISLAGTLAIANGGTNSTATATAGGAAYGTGTAYAVTAAGTSGNVLISAGAAAPAFGALAIGTANTNISGALTPTNGGTGVATLSGIAFGNGTSAFTAASTAQVLAVVGTLPVANGGTGTASPAIVAGTGITVSGSFPNQTINASGGGSGLLLNIQYITASATYTATSGTTFVIVEVVGGGGGGGSSGNTSTGSTGSTGGTSSFGALVSATGGAGGVGSASSNSLDTFAGGAGGAGSSGDLNISGTRGSWGIKGLSTGQVNGGGGNAAIFVGGAPYKATNGTISGDSGITNSGGGGGAGGTNTSTMAGGGGGGGYARKKITSGFSGVTVTVGAGGAGGSVFGSGTPGSGGSGIIIVYEYK